jgi:hypothetical protein
LVPRPVECLDIVATGGKRVRRDTGEIVATVRDVEMTDVAYLDDVARRFAPERAIAAVRAIERRRQRDRERRRRKR